MAELHAWHYVDRWRVQLLRAISSCDCLDRSMKAAQFDGHDFRPAAVGLVIWSVPKLRALRARTAHHIESVSKPTSIRVVQPSPVAHIAHYLCIADHHPSHPSNDLVTVTDDGNESNGRSCAIDDHPSGTHITITSASTEAHNGMSRTRHLSHHYDSPHSCIPPAAARRP